MKTGFDDAIHLREQACPRPKLAEAALFETDNENHTRGCECFIKQSLHGGSSDDGYRFMGTSRRIILESNRSNMSLQVCSRILDGAALGKGLMTF